MPRLIDMYDAALLDLDGTVYVGPDAVPHAVDSLTTAARIGVRLVYTTNNAARTPAQVGNQLRGLGLELDDSQVLTSSQVAAHHIVEQLGAGAKVLPVGGPGVAAALHEVGLAVVDSADDGPVAVMQGYGPDVSWRNLAEASYAINRGALH
jgi:glycerol 3-phosphatase-2